MRCAWWLCILNTLISSSVFANSIFLDKNITALQNISTVYVAQPLALAHAKTTNNAPSLARSEIEKKLAWLRATLINTEPTTLAILFSINNPLFESVSRYDQQMPLLWKVGHQAGLSDPLSILQRDEHLSHIAAFNGLLIGFILSLVFICMLLYSLSKKVYFGLASALCINLCLLLSHFYGFGYVFFDSFIASLYPYVVPSMLLVLPYLFSRLLKQLKLDKPSRIDLLTSWCSYLLLISLFITCWLSLEVFFRYSLVASLLITLLNCFAITLSIKHNASQPLYVLLISQSVYFASLLYLCSAAFSIFDPKLYTVNWLSMSFLLCAISISFAAIKQFLIQQDTQQTALTTTLAQIKAKDAATQAHLAQQQQDQQDLEANIEARTFELQITLRELEEKNRALELLNMEDPLTHIKNRRYFDKKLVMDLRRSKREQTPLSIIMFDIDHFKSINDSYGHLTGDQTIRAVADIIKRHLKRPLDEVARYGGEEFITLLPNTPLPGALDIAESIRKSIMDATITVAGTQIKFTISAGVYSAIAENINNPGLFTDYADKALYRAKQTGRNRVVSFPLLD